MERRTLHIPHINALDSYLEPDVILRVLDERGVRGHIDKANWLETFPYRPLSTFTAAHSDKNLYIDFFVRSSFLRAENCADQSPVSQDSCVEVFLQPKIDGEYWNFEFNCIGAINASHRYERPSPTRLTSDELVLIKRYPSCGTSTFKEKVGLCVWNLLVVIPLSLLGLENAAPGTVLRGNFYKCSSASSYPHYLSWNPIIAPKPDFHRPEFFGDIILE